MSTENAPFKQAKEHTPGLTPIVFFYNQFYYLLFDFAPEVLCCFRFLLFFARFCP